MKTRMVVGPPPLKYLKKYGKGGKFTKRYQNGGQLSNLANTISTVGGIASAIPGVGAIPGAIASVAAPILQAVSAQQAARSSFNKLYSSTPMMAKGGKLVKYAKGGSVEPPIIYNAPETTVTASRLPKGYSKMTKEQQALYDKLMKERPATGAAQTMDGFNDPIFNLITLPGNVKGVIQLSAALPGLVKAAPSVIKSATQIPKAARAALKKVDLSSLNPNRFKPTEGMMYRGIGKEGFEDAIQTGVFRAKQVDVPRGTGTIQLTKSFGQSPYFTPKFNTAKGYGAEYIAEVPKSAADWTQRYIRTDWSQYSKTPIPVNAGKILKKDWWKGYKEIDIPKKEKGGLIKRKDGSYSQRGLWDNIRANKGSGKKPTKQMLEQERKIKNKMEFGGTLKGVDDLTFYKGRKHTNGGIMVSAKGTPSKQAVAEVEGGETRYLRKGGTYIFSDKLLV